MKLRALAAALLLAAGAALAQAGNEAEPAGIVGRYLLVDHHGRTVTNEDFLGRFQLIAFGYTYCPDICPTTLAEMAEVLKLLGPKAERLQALFVSVDPERDTAEVLKSYTGFFDARILGLTGSPELVRRAADHFKVRYEKAREPGAAPGQYSVDHSAGTYLLGPDGGFLHKFAYATPPSEMAARIGAWMDQAPTFPTRGRRRP